jgi:hypothetical protein
MRPCIRCKHVKFWFQFFVLDVSICDYVTRADTCKSCANILKTGAVRRFEREYGNEKMLERMKDG